MGWECKVMGGDMMRLPPREYSGETVLLEYIMAYHLHSMTHQLWKLPLSTPFLYSPFHLLNLLSLPPIFKKLFHFFPSLSFSFGPPSKIIAHLTRLVKILIIYLFWIFAISMNFSTFFSRSLIYKKCIWNFTHFMIHFLKKYVI